MTFTEPEAEGGPDARTGGRGDRRPVHSRARRAGGAFALLDALEEAREAGLTALAARSGLPKTTAYRLLEQLAELGAVERHGARYRPGPRLFRLGSAWQPHPALRAAARGRCGGSRPPPAPRSGSARCGRAAPWPCWGPPAWWTTWPRCGPGCPGPGTRPPERRWWPRRRR
ncbi:helix-turn-helix domain-containing protein [Streptomyces stramineus]